MSDNERKRERLTGELLELINELRVQLPGVQVLFAFMLTVPFQQRFDRVMGVDRTLFFVGFVCASLATAFLTAPSVYHRLHWRSDVRDQDQMLRTANRLALAGSVFLLLAMISTSVMVAHVLLGAEMAIVIGSVTTVAFGWLWYGLPLVRRRRDRRAAPH
jgi:hypothetical protein